MLPPELLLAVFKQLNKSDLREIRLACRQFHDLCQDLLFNHTQIIVTSDPIIPRNTGRYPQYCEYITLSNYKYTVVPFDRVRRLTVSFQGHTVDSEYLAALISEVLPGFRGLADVSLYIDELPPEDIPDVSQFWHLVDALFPSYRLKLKLYDALHIVKLRSLRKLLPALVNLAEIEFACNYNQLGLLRHLPFNSKITKLVVSHASFVNETLQTACNLLPGLKTLTVPNIEYSKVRLIELPDSLETLKVSSFSDICIAGPNLKHLYIRALSLKFLKFEFPQLTDLTIDMQCDHNCDISAIVYTELPRYLSSKWPQLKSVEAFNCPVDNHLHYTESIVQTLARTPIDSIALHFKSPPPPQIYAALDDSPIPVISIDYTQHTH
ncbi:hypothetical protein TRVA0_006S01662 [Trichomonascus vanleenenianus]|uniref:F-box protein n=1 Tax=Trichomonascus vanleenenianus TaxID=2268995 RepID=UPI003ECA6C6D